LAPTTPRVAHPDLAFNASFAAVVQTPTICPRLGPRRQGRRSAELRFSLLRVCDPPCPRNSLPCPALPPLPSSSSQSAKPQLCIECIEAFKCAVRCLRSFADRCTALIPGQKPVQRFHSSQPRLSIQKSALENASDCSMTYSNRTNPPISSYCPQQRPPLRMPGRDELQTSKLSRRVSFSPR